MPIVDSESKDIQPTLCATDLPVGKRQEEQIQFGYELKELISDL
jgi:hypothetical protein